MRLLFIAILAVFFSSSANAAPFCMEINGLPDECIYYDPDLCLARARTQNGICSPNSREIRFDGGAGSYCLVLSGGSAECHYTDFRSCQQVARNNKALCERNPRRRQPSEPFKFDRDLIY